VDDELMRQEIAAELNAWAVANGLPARSFAEWADAVREHVLDRLADPASRVRYAHELWLEVLGCG
jgi:hypothetical protein